MTDKKLTDYDIVMALEDAEYKVNGVVTQGFYLSGETFNAVVDLINSQKALIKRLTSGKCVYLSDDEITEYCVEGPCPNYKTEAEIKAEAYKECIEKVKEKSRKTEVVYVDEIISIRYAISNKNLNIILKELECDNNV